MNFNALGRILMMMFAFLQPASAYSPSFTVDGWDAARLKEAGITVTPWEHNQMGEGPPRNWVKVTYDRSKMGDQDVVMTLEVYTDNGEFAACSRVEREKGECAEISLIFTTDANSTANSSVQIIAPQLLSIVTERAYGDPGFAGYTLSLSRILQMAGEAPAGNPPTGSGAADQGGADQPATRSELKRGGGDKP